MSERFDLGPAAHELRRVVEGVEEDQLDGPTPCTDWTVAGLLAHIHQFASVFTTNAAKAPPDPPQQLTDDWRDAIPRQLDALVVAWRDPAAWEGRVSAGGVEMAAADNPVVALEELTTHGWDLARATGQDFTIADDDDPRLDVLERFLGLFGGAPFGEAVHAAPEASRFERFLANSGRDAGWAPTA